MSDFIMTGSSLPGNRGVPEVPALHVFLQNPGKQQIRFNPHVVDPLWFCPHGGMLTAGPAGPAAPSSPSFPFSP